MTVTPADVERVFADHPGRDGALWLIMLAATADVLLALGWAPKAPDAADKAKALLSEKRTVSINRASEESR